MVFSTAYGSHRCIRDVATNLFFKVLLAPDCRSPIRLGSIHALWEDAREKPTQIL